ncbi:glycosyl hydrolase [Methylocapsa polymorpha]|uniref:Glycosyl hydrolase n=1 Tax=Methylocapsa polymorpha TaxID=3080828 RepID=A0ABZ0HWT0_9HYPH|nr:glycosyl hydrolase [Methylocapsa sp. RX1]
MTHGRAAALAVLSPIVICALLSGIHPAYAAAPGDVTADGVRDPQDDASPWGIASGAEWAADYPKFNLALQTVGVRWLRSSYPWHAIQPTEGTWIWRPMDDLVANARANHIHLTAGFGYLATWASADGGTYAFPIKNIQYWRDYVSAMVARYHNDIKYWEVWNEFNGGFAVNATPQTYAELVRETYDAAKKIDPTAKIGVSVANFDVGYLDAAIKAGGADHFDYICVHPYENLAALAEGGEISFLSMAGALRQMLAANKQRTDIPLWITEIGATAPVQPDAAGDRRQAEALAKAYLLSIASGFQRVFWFEARGPSYGKETDFGVIRADWTPRPSYDALKAMIDALGQKPQYLGWLDMDKGGYGFLYRGRNEDVLAVWSPPGTEHKITFPADVGVIDLAGGDSTLRAGQGLTLTGTPLLLTKVPASLARQARDKAGKPFPWGGDYAKAEVVLSRLGAVNVDSGVKQVDLQTTLSVTAGAESWRRTDFTRPEGDGRYVQFRVDPQFVPYGTTNLEITAVVRRAAPETVAGMNIDYESLKGYRGGPNYQEIPGDEQWHELTWKVSDANFVGGWGWNFRLSALGSAGEFDVKEVRVRKSTTSQESKGAADP